MDQETLKKLVLQRKAGLEAYAQMQVEMERARSVEDRIADLDVVLGLGFALKALPERDRTVEDYRTWRRLPWCKLSA